MESSMELFIVGLAFCYLIVEARKQGRQKKGPEPPAIRYSNPDVSEAFGDYPDIRAVVKKPISEI